MFGFLDDVIGTFGFTKYTTIIVAISLVALLGCLFGGMMSSILLAHGGPIKPRPLYQRTSFRMILALEITVVIFAVWYHTAVNPNLTLAHLVFWAFTLLSAPVLGVIGRQITYLVFAGKIDANMKAYEYWDRNQKTKALAEELHG